MAVVVWQRDWLYIYVCINIHTYIPCCYGLVTHLHRRPTEFDPLRDLIGSSLNFLHKKMNERTHSFSSLTGTRNFIKNQGLLKTFHCSLGDFNLAFLRLFPTLISFCFIYTILLYTLKTLATWNSSLKLWILEMSHEIIIWKVTVCTFFVSHTLGFVTKW